MKKIHFSLLILLTSFVAFAFNSCNDDDGYSLDKFVVSLATINPLGENSYYLTMDDGTTLWPAASNIVYIPKENQRALVNFTLLPNTLSEYDHYIKINYLQQILTKSIVELNSENETEIGNDPIKLLEYWIGDDYLNIHFGFNSGGEKSHLINLVQNTLVNITQKDGKIVLELRHNTNGDPARYGSKSYAAFDLRPFQSDGKNSIEITIKALDFNNETKEYPITYKYNDANNVSVQRPIINIPDSVKLN